SMVSSRRIAFSWRTNRGTKASRLVRRFSTVYRSNFTDQVQGRRQGVGARSPLRGAHFAWVRGNVLGSFYFAQQFLGVAADSIIVHFHDFDLAGRVDDERTAQRKALFLDQHLEIARKRRGRVADQRILHLDDGI